MTIQFDITDTEADIISIQYGYDGKTDKDEFVLEQFKEFGRNCITSHAIQVSSVSEEAAKKVALEAVKDSISF